MHRWLAGVLFFLAAATGAQAHELLDRLDSCIGHLDQELDVGYERIAARCPQLAANLAHSAWSPWLPADWNQPRNQLSAQGLTELRTLLARSLKPDAPARAPSTQKVAAVLQRISAAEDAHPGWWAQFKAWLRRITSGREGGSNWLSGWLGALDLSQRAARLIAWLALSLVVAVAVAILINELRIAGLLKVRAPAADGGRPQAGDAPAGWRLDDLEGREPREQPGLLLQLIAERLTAQGRLPAARALTNRELLRAARLADQSERDSLAELAAAAEQLRYSTRDFAAASLASAISAGRRMLARQVAAPRA